MIVWIVIGVFVLYLLYLCTTIPSTSTKIKVEPTIFDQKPVVSPVVAASSEKNPYSSKDKSYEVIMGPLTPKAMEDLNWLKNNNIIDNNLMKLRRETEIKRKEDRDLAFRIKTAQVHRANLEQRFPEAFLTE